MHKSFVYLFTLLLLTSCGRSPLGHSDQAVFRMNLPAGCSSLDPAFARDLNTIWMTSQLFNGLVSVDTELEVQASIASHWVISENQLVYTFSLDSTVFYHKNEIFGSDSTRRVTAADFKYSFTRICDPNVSSYGGWIFNQKVQGVEAFAKGETADIQGFEIVDVFTFRIHLIEAFPPFLRMLAMPYAFVLPHEAIEKYGKDFRNHPVGTGPFRFKNWQEGSSLILLRNENYFESNEKEQIPKLEAIHVKFIESELSAFIEFSQGRLDFINGLDNSFKDEIIAPGGEVKEAYATRFKFIVIPQLNTEFLGILMDSTMDIAKGHPLLDKRIRQALNFAIDREKLVKYLLNGNGFPANAGIVPQGMPGFNPEVVKGYSFDPDRSAALLNAAGYPGGKGFPVLKLASNPKYQPIMEFVQKSFENIGVRMEIENMQGATLRELASKGELNMWRASWIADYPDAENYLSLFYSGYFPPGGANRMRYSNSKLDSLYQSVLHLAEDSLRFPVYQQMENILIEDAPVIPLFYDKILRIVQPNVVGMETNAMNLLDLRFVEKTK